ncbi:MAG: hypothetical protein ABR990_07730 [Terracidiphilus sp.]
MIGRNLRYFFIFLLAACLAASLQAQKIVKGPWFTPSVTNGDQPPCCAMMMSTARARTVLRESMQKSLTGEMKNCVIKLCTKWDYDSHQIWMRANGFDYLREETWFEGNRHNILMVHVDFSKDQNYISAYHPPYFSCGGVNCYSVLRIIRLKRKHVLSSTIPAELLSCSGNCDQEWRKKKTSSTSLDINWPSAENARRFADAFNRLLYAAHSGELEREAAAFTKAAADYRAANPKPPLDPEANGERFLAEDASRRGNLDEAAAHFQAALKIQPAWPSGWISLASIYAGQMDYFNAADAMKHYLELLPDAPNAKAAREQMIAWEEKANPPAELLLENPQQPEDQDVQPNEDEDPKPEQGQTNTKPH